MSETPLLDGLAREFPRNSGSALPFALYGLQSTKHRFAMINISGLEFAHRGNRRAGVAGRVRLLTASVTLIDRTTVVLLHEPPARSADFPVGTPAGWKTGDTERGFRVAMRDFKIEAAAHDESSSDHILV